NGATATLHLPMLDVDIDSNNDSGFTPPPGVIDAEDIAEQNPVNGKIIQATTGDIDADGVPDFADYDGIEHPVTHAKARFVPITVTLSQNVAAANPTSINFTFEYSESGPDQLIGGNGTPLQPGAGLLRIWKAINDQDPAPL